MSSNELLDLYQDWKRLTEREGSAIVSSDWREVKRCQEGKRQLQPAIIRRAEASHAEQESQESQKQIRALINELILLETENSAALQKRLASVEQAREELEQTGHRLRRIHRSYVPSPGRAAWNQYS